MSFKGHSTPCTIPVTMYVCMYRKRGNFRGVEIFAVFMGTQITSKISIDFHETSILAIDSFSKSWSVSITCARKGYRLLFGLTSTLAVYKCC